MTIRPAPSAAKTRVDNESVLQFVQETVSGDILSLDSITGGELSQAFAFDDFVIRINTRDGGFKKDAYAYKHFSSETVPIPEILQSGRMNDKLFFAISRKVPGKTIDHLKKTDKILTSLVTTLDALHHVDISGTTGYGIWNTEGHAPEKDWGTFLLQPILNHSGARHQAFKNSPEEESLIRTIILHYERLIDHCPNARHLVHGDYGFDNTFSDGTDITGVIDWDCSLYGDFVYDIAWLSFWDAATDYPRLFQDHYKERGTPIPAFAKRLLCYQLHIAIGALGFFSASKQPGKYRMAKERVLGLISA